MTETTTPESASASSAETRPAAAPDARPAVAVQRLTKVFKDFWLRDRARAVEDLSFEIREHEIFGLLGPNGSGKSTTIKLMLGLLRPTSGRIAVFGKSPTDVATKKRIGYLPEESYLYPFLNARETLDYYARLFELDHRTRVRRIDELLDMVGLTHAQFRQVREYSKGMQRRIGIAQALINDPDLLILDEPTTGLDPIGTRQVKDLILQLGRRGKTVLLSSHLLADVEDVVDRMIILYGGKKRDEGTCEQLLTTEGKTTIETDDLDDETLAEIDAIIRRRTGGEKSILRVAKPRQKLEELFLGIVERAQQEKASTSGAMHGGETAAFLKAEDTPEGDELIASLTDDGTAPQPMPIDEPEHAPDAESPEEDATEAVVADLLGDDAAAEPDPATTTAPPRPNATSDPSPASPADDADVDLGMIDSLLGDDAGDDDDTEDSKKDTTP